MQYKVCQFSVHNDDVWMRVVDASALEAIEIDWAFEKTSGLSYRARKYSADEFARLRQKAEKMKVAKLALTRQEFKSLYLDVSQLETFSRAAECSRARMLPVLQGILNS